MSFSFSKRSYVKREKLSYLFQGLRLFDELSGYENIAIKNKLTDFKSLTEINDMAEKLGVENYLNKKVGFLSFGQKQRIALIRALCQPYEYLLLDEPFSHLDTDNQKTACDLISSECRKQNATLLLTSLGSGYYLNYDKIYEI
jgi:ABC-type lipoprotein export system ATPase subunit